MSTKLLLFDIDGTLLDTGGVGLRSLKDAFFETFGDHHPEEHFPQLDLAGSRPAPGGEGLSVLDRIGCAGMSHGLPLDEPIVTAPTDCPPLIEVGGDQRAQDHPAPDERRADAGLRLAGSFREHGRHWVISSRAASNRST